MATSGSKTVSTAFGNVKLAWKEIDRDAVNNKVKLRFTLTRYAKNSISSSASKKYSIVVAGSTLKSGTTTIGGSGTKTIAYADKWISGNSSGNASFSYSFSLQADITWSGSWVGTVKGSSTGAIDTIDRQAPSRNSLSLSSSTYNSLTIYLESSAQCNYAAYKINGGSWQYFTPPSAIVENTGSATKTISGLSPYTTYKIEVAYRRTYNHVWGYSSAVNMTTKKPNPPRCNTPILVDKTHKSVSFNLSGAYGAGHGSSGGYYQYGIDGVLSWTRGGNTGNVITGLKPNTTYEIRAQLVDAYGQAGEATPLTVTTNKPPMPTAGSVKVTKTDYSQITYSLTGYTVGDMASLSKVEYNFNSQGWTSLGTAISVIKTGLKPSTAYSMQFRITDNYGQIATTSAITTSTLTPDKVNAGTVQIENLTHSSVELKLIGYGVGEGAKIVRIEYNFNSKGWTSLNLLDEVTINNLSETTKYTVQFKVVDSLGRESLTEIVTFTTLEDSFVYIINGTSVTKHELYIVTTEGVTKIGKTKTAII